MATRVLPVAVGAAVLIALARRRPRPDWHSVTVLGGPDGIDVEDGPLGALRGVELRLQPAPGDRGTELHARHRRSATPAATERLRAALRDTKSLAETGGVLQATPRPHGQRRRTPWGLAQDAVERRAKGLGLG